MCWVPTSVCLQELFVQSLKQGHSAFLIQIEASETHEGLFAVAEEIFKENPGGLFKLELGKKKKIQTWTQKSVLAARDVTLMTEENIWKNRREKNRNNGI